MGVGGPVSGLDILPEPVPWSEEVLQKIEDQLSDLIQSLDNELEYLDRMGKHEHLRRSSRRPKAARLSFSVSC